jgi:uncharacterized protein
MKIFISGGTGFVGQRLAARMLDQGHEVTSVGRSRRMEMNRPNFHFLSADTAVAGSWQEALGEMDAVVNLAGASIFKRWTDEHKKEMYDSRILTTRNIADALTEKPEMVLVSTSAVGYYGDRKDDILNETDAPGNDFLGLLAKDWEGEAFKALDKGIRVVVTRFGVVLGPGGGALATMMPLFKAFLGGPLGTGKQWFPWIHMDDLVSAIDFVINHKEISGPLNFTSPIPIRQRDFARALGRMLKRPAYLPAPSFMVRLIMGELGTSLLGGQKVIPEKLIRAGYKFKFMEIGPALENIFNGESR